MRTARALTSFALALWLVACSGSGRPPSPPTPRDLDISGVVKGWNARYGAGIRASTLSGEVIATDDINADGNFELRLRPPQRLRERPVGGCTPTPAPSVTVTPASLRTANVILSSAESDLLTIVRVGPPNARRVASYYYANESGNIIGQETCPNGSTYNYSVGLRRGWNILVAEVAPAPTGAPTRIRYTSLPPDATMPGYEYRVSNPVQ